MTTAQALATIAIIAAATLLTRALPFILFPANETTPKTIVYLGQALPYAITGMLVVYCAKDVSPLAAPHGAPELLGIGATIGLYRWRHNALLAIGVGTIAYMLLVRYIFL